MTHISLVVALMLAWSSRAKEAPTASGRTDCVGYHTLRLLGSIEYPVQQTPFNRKWSPEFSDGLDAWDNNAYLRIEGSGIRDASMLAIRVTALTDETGLKALVDRKNEEQQKQKDEFIATAAAADKVGSPGIREIAIRSASSVAFYQPIVEKLAFGRLRAQFDDPRLSEAAQKDFLDIQVLVGNRIVSATRKLTDTPQQTVDEFLKHYRPREPFEVPNGPGACLPYATVTGEPEPATVGVSIRLLDHPDVVVYLRDSRVDTNTDTVDPKEILAKEIRLHTHGARDAIASNKLKPIHSVTLAGQPGVGAFITIFRDPDVRDREERRKAKPVLDWGYVAYSPGDKSAPLGTSSTLMFKVMRYSRYAKEPMTESEFHKLAQTIAASIRRRPDAWAPR